MVEPWEIISSEDLGHYKIFKLRQDTAVSPRNGKTLPFYVLETPDWINVIPITPEGDILLVHQYRHGTREITIEVPAGMVDPEDADPAAAAARELLEETGYVARKIVLLGEVAANPAFLDNRCFHLLALDVRQVQDPQLEDGEDIFMELMPQAKVKELIRNGRINHSLTISAFYYLGLLEEREIHKKL